MSCVTRMMFKVVNVQYKESTFFFSGSCWARRWVM